MHNLFRTRYFSYYGFADIAINPFRTSHPSGSRLMRTSVICMAYRNYFSLEAPEDNSLFYKSLVSLIPKKTQAFLNHAWAKQQARHSSMACSSTTGLYNSLCNTSYYFLDDFFLLCCCSNSFKSSIPNSACLT